MNPYAVIAALVIFGGSVAGAFFYGEGVGEARCVARQARDDQVRAETRAAALEGAAAAIAANKPRNVTIKQEVQREIETRVQYADCRHSPEQLQRLNEALTGRGPEPAGPGIVPRAGAPVGRQLRSDDSEAR